MVIAACEVKTDRLVLRAPEPTDFADCAALWGDPEVMRFISGQPLSEEESWMRFLRHIGHWSAMDFGYWAVRETKSGRFVGLIGFGNFRRAIAPPLGEAPELGWMLATGAQGRGFAIEAVWAATQWGDRRFGGRETVCIIAPDHVRSLRLAGKVGFRESRRAVYKGHEIIVLARRGQTG